MERMGPIRPNVINKWTLFQAKEHPERYDLDDGIVIAKEDIKKTTKKAHLRKNTVDRLYGDSVVVQMGEKPAETTKAVVKPAEVKKLAPSVRVDLYMESLCPDTYNFIRTSLSKVAHDPSIMAITDLHIYMFGKGNQISKEPPKFNCQHGPTECQGNLVENCIVKHANPGAAVDIILCLFGRRQFDSTTISSCMRGIEDGAAINERVTQCMQGEGSFLLQKAYDKTPRNLGFVPSMRINKGSVTNASFNLKDTICKNYSGAKPSSCP